MTLEERLYHAIASNGPLPGLGPDKVVVAHPSALARLTRLGEDGAQHAALDVRVTHLSQQLLGMRSPVALAPWGHYRLQIGSGAQTFAYEIRVIASRARPDGEFDVAGAYLASEQAPVQAAA